MQIKSDFKFKFKASSHITNIGLLHDGHMLLVWIEYISCERCQELVNSNVIPNTLLQDRNSLLLLGVVRVNCVQLILKSFVGQDYVKVNETVRTPCIIYYFSQNWTSQILNKWILDVFFLCANHFALFNYFKYEK